MDWYKHSTGSHDDPDVSDAMDEFGHVGYSVFFITLEIYGSEFNHLDSEGWLTISKRFLARKLRLSQAKVEQILNFYSDRQRIITKTSKNTISINCPKFVDIASNWTRRRTSTPTEALQRPYVAPTAIEEKKKRIEEDIPPLPPKKRGDEYETDFLTFWNSYPKKAKKPTAYREWKKLGSKRPDIAVLTACIQKQATWRPWIEGYIPDPERWLKNERWLDEQPPTGGNGNGGIRTARSDPRDKTLQSREDAEVAAIIARREAAKQSARRDPGGDAKPDDAPDFSNAGLTG